MPKVRRSRKPQLIKEEIFEVTLEEPTYITDDGAHWSLVHSLDSLDKRMTIMSEQFHSLMEDFAKQKVLIRQILQKPVVTDTDLENKFPITSKKALIQINNDIEQQDRNCYIEVISQILQKKGKGVRKNLKYIIADHVTTQYNIEGVSGKESLKSLEHFYSALIESIETEGAGSPEEKLRYAILLQKSRVKKLNSVNKQKAREIIEDWRAKRES
ncbi:uncharacterized protein LOC117784161 [Drosophila innubila]|uniref:uncharacterized protein LOC117784161 n=1 Tax=Drosophila innubila TaxID=198719 RepID=UPI00148C6C34|nr:uncharacterized protein LOC117784161 [Drosophila innubila]